MGLFTKKKIKNNGMLRIKEGEQTVRSKIIQSGSRILHKSKGKQNVRSQSRVVGESLQTQVGGER